MNMKAYWKTYRLLKSEAKRVVVFFCQSSGGKEFQLPCNLTCECDMKTFAPICTSTGFTYYSACHAGCANLTHLPGDIAAASVSHTLVERPPTTQLGAPSLIRSPTMTTDLVQIEDEISQT